MSDQLKQALLNAGVISKKDIERERVVKRHKMDNSKMKREQIRIVCDTCGKTAPDVERYTHKNRMIKSKEWLCIMCADEYCIDDTCRQTAQSSHSKSKLFRRQYGRTKRI